MLAPAPELLRFELSIGNYGDTGDPTCRPAASTTPHGHPLFDGERRGHPCPPPGSPQGC